MTGIMIGNGLREPSDAFVVAHRGNVARNHGRNLGRNIARYI